MTFNPHEETSMAIDHIIGTTVTDEVMAKAHRAMRLSLDGGLDYIDAAYEVAVNGWIGLSPVSEGADAARNDVFYRLINEFRPAGVQAPS